MRNRLILSAVLAAAAFAQPDLSGTYDISTLTPLARPAALGDRLTLTDAEAKAYSARAAAQREKGGQASDPNRKAPPVGGDGTGGAAGNVGGYNTVWIDNGTSAFRIDGQWRTSIIVDPPNGRMPAMVPEAAERAAARAKLARPNMGDAWWLKENISPGPYDDPELRPLAERCLLGFGSSAGPPALPVLYNNLKQIVQTKNHIMILNEMVHDARIIRMNAKHEPPDVRRWLGDSVGHWEGETLVVDTTNFTDQPALAGASRTLHVVERFRRIDAKTLLYRFTVEDPSVWTRPWTGELPWPATENRIFEYACHEGNYSFGNILRGARLLEADALAGKK
jgi:hypothetical protein